jgi:hypothetical protein
MYSSSAFTTAQHCLDCHGHIDNTYQKGRPLTSSCIIICKKRLSMARTTLSTNEDNGASP